MTFEEICEILGTTPAAICSSQSNSQAEELNMLRRIVAVYYRGIGYTYDQIAALINRHRYTIAKHIDEHNHALKFHARYIEVYVQFLNTYSHYLQKTPQ